MTRWKARIFIAVHLVMLTAGAYFVADVVNELVARKLEASIRPDDRASVRPVPSAGEVNPSSGYQRILEGDLFHPAQRGQTAAAPMVDTPALPGPLDLAMTLIGTGEGDGVTSFAVIEDRSTREQRVYRLNDVVKDGAVLAKVERNQVTLRLGTQRQILKTYTDGTEEVTPPESGTAVRPRGDPLEGASQPSGIKQVQANRWVLDKQEVTAALNNLPQLLTKARVIPNFTDGRPDGFKIFSIAPDSLYAKIGLQNGDVLQQINGVEVKDPENFMRVFQQLKDETNIALDFVRNNRRESFSYEIR
ncbi:MAG: type II secretion system protein GspC [Nitrospiria bacterium]